MLLLPCLSTANFKQAKKILLPVTPFSIATIELEGNFFRCVPARAHLHPLMTRKSRAVWMRNAILGKHFPVCLLLVAYRLPHNLCSKRFLFQMQKSSKWASGQGGERGSAPGVSKKWEEKVIAPADSLVPFACFFGIACYASQTLTRRVKKGSERAMA